MTGPNAPVYDDRHHPDFPPHVRAVMERVGHLLGGVTPPGWCFAFLLFEESAGGTAGYISNANRADMVLALREQADLLEGIRRHPAPDPEGR